MRASQVVQEDRAIQVVAEAGSVQVESELCAAKDRAIQIAGKRGRRKMRRRLEVVGEVSAGQIDAEAAAVDRNSGEDRTGQVALERGSVQIVGECGIAQIRREGSAVEVAGERSSA